MGVAKYLSSNGCGLVSVNLRARSDGRGQVLVIKWVWVGECEPEGVG
jgi:hypothetical protein